MAILKPALVFFDQAVRDGSIRKAAESLHIASSALNRQLLQLEQELGTELFERLPRGIRPTAAGETLLSYIRRWKKDAQQLRQEIGRLHGGIRCTIGIAAAESLTTNVLPAAMIKLQQAYPLIDFSVISGDNHILRSALLAKDVDLVCGFDLAPAPRNETIFALPARIGVIAKADHPLASQPSLSISDCLAFPVIAPTPAWLSHSMLGRLFDANDRQFQIVARVERISTLKSLVSSGLGIAFMSAVGLEDEIRDGRLAWIPLEDGAVEPTVISLVVSRDRALPKMMLGFIESLKAELLRFS